MALTDDDGELHQVDIPSQASCNQVKVVDIVRAQKEEPHIGRVLKVSKANQKPTVGQKQKESPLVRKLLSGTNFMKTRRVVYCIVIRR